MLLHFYMSSRGSGHVLEHILCIIICNGAPRIKSVITQRVANFLTDNTPFVDVVYILKISFQTCYPCIHHCT